MLERLQRGQTNSCAGRYGHSKPGLTPCMVKYYGEAPPSIFFQVDSGGRRQLDSTSKVHQVNDVGLSLLSLAL